MFCDIIADMEKIVSLNNVTKIYNGRIIINEVSHDFHKGDSIAFTGHNGCGKSTLLKILAGLVRINKGKVEHSRKIRFSYVPEKMPALDITAYSYLKSVASMEGVEESEFISLAEDFFVEDMLYTKMRNLSKGSIQKIGVIQALMAPKDIILLDEPLNGQDADSQAVFISKIKEMKNNGITVFMSCHERKLIEELSDKQFTIIKGKLTEVSIDKMVMYKIFVKDSHLKPWPDMTRNGYKYMLVVRENEIKNTVQKLFAEGWELVGVEEFI